MLYKSFIESEDETSLLCSILESSARGEHYYYYEGMAIYLFICLLIFIYLFILIFVVSFGIVIHCSFRSLKYH